MATIKDIAKQAGVATSTVSAILNERADCYASAETRARVRRTAEELGYRANRLARGLAQGRSRLLGLLLLNVRYPTFADAASGVEDEAAAAGYSVLLCNTHARNDKTREQLQMLAENRVEGIISVTPSILETPGPILTLKPKGVPLIAINRHIQHPEVSSIVMKNRDAIHMLTEHLIQQGHRRILFLGGLDHLGIGLQPTQASIDRREGYCEAMIAAGLEPVVVSASWRGPDDMLRAAQLHTEHALCSANPPTAIVTVSDYAAMGVLRGCRAEHRRVPEDVAVTGFDHLDVGRYAEPALTTVRQPFYEAGRLAVRQLLSWREHTVAPLTCLDCELLYRESTGKDYVADVYPEESAFPYYCYPQGTVS